MKFFLDMDGVIADFNKRCIELIGCTLSAFPDSQSGWDALGKHKDDIYLQLEPMEDARILVDGVFDIAKTVGYEVGVLTAIPKKGRVANAATYKHEWISRHFPELRENFSIGPYAEDKWKHCVLPTDVLIDDMQRNIDQWNAAHGIGILHINAEDSLSQLTKAVSKWKF